MTDMPNTNSGELVHPPLMQPRAWSLIAMGLLAVTALLLIVMLTPIVRTWSTPVPPSVEPLSDAKVKIRKNEFSTRITSATEKVKTRSPFAPPAIAAAPVPKVPARYGGPSVIGIAAGQVYFSDGQRINVGQTHDEIEVISLNAPWSVTLGWRGGSYEVTLLERNPVSFSEPSLLKDTLFKTTPIAKPAVVEPPKTENNQAPQPVIAPSEGLLIRIPISK